MTTTQQTLNADTMAAWSADNRLVELYLAHVLPALGHTEAPCPQADLALNCRVDISNSPNLAIRRVDVHVVLTAEPEHVLAHRIAFLSALP